MSGVIIVYSKKYQEHVCVEDLLLAVLGYFCHISIERLSVFEVKRWEDLSDYHQLKHKPHQMWLFSEVWVKCHHQYKGKKYPVYVDKLIVLIIIGESRLTLKNE